MIKDLVVNLPAEDRAAIAGEYAISIARRFGAHVSGIALAYEPMIPGISFDGVVESAVAAYREQTEAAAQGAADAFARSAERAGVSFERHVLRSTASEAGSLIARAARRCDLAILAQPEPQAEYPDRMTVETAVFQSGRPAIVVPYIHKEGLKLERVLVCWDGGRAAARAVADSISLLQGAKAIEVVTVSRADPPRDELPGFDIAHHLARHGLNVELKRMVAEDIDAANTILSYAADRSADLIVMGGFGHSRLRDFVLGGVTQAMLDSMTVPTLMSH